MPHEPYRFVLTPDRLARVLTITLATLLVFHGLALLVSHGFGYQVAKGFVPLFHLDFEANLPTLYAFILLLSCAATAAWTGALERARPRHRRAWFLVAVLFVLIAADEVFGFHEQIGDFLFAEYGEAGLPLIVRSAPYSIVVLALSVVMLRWFLELDRPAQLRLVLAGAVFLTGAIGFEYLGSYYYDHLPPDREVYRTLTGDLLATAEEACEFAGASIFLHTLVRRLGGVSFRALNPQDLAAGSASTH